MNKRLQRGCVVGLIFLLAALPGAAQSALEDGRPAFPNGFVQVQCDPNTDPECDLPPDNGGNEGQPPGGGQTPQREGPSDQDSDGIPDAQDQCPNVWGQKPDGCPIGDDNATPGYDQAPPSDTTDTAASTSGDLTAGGAGCLVINEVLWAGTRFSRNHQYIELHNRCSAMLHLGGLKLQLVEKPMDPLVVQAEILLQGTLNPQGYYLLFNNAMTLSNIQPDMVADFQLLQSGMAVLLVDGAGNRISSANAGNPTETAWFAGQLLRDGDSFSMERNEGQSTPDEPSSWHTNDGKTRFGKDVLGNPINGTPGQANSPAPEER